jgi:hypothetical protein
MHNHASRQAADFDKPGNRIIRKLIRQICATTDSTACLIFLLADQPEQDGESD